MVAGLRQERRCFAFDSLANDFCFTYTSGPCDLLKQELLALLNINCFTNHPE